MFLFSKFELLEFGISVIPDISNVRTSARYFDLQLPSWSCVQIKFTIPDRYILYVDQKKWYKDDVDVYL